MYVVMASVKCELQTYLTFLQKFETPNIRKHIIFFSHNISRESNNQFSALDNDKMTSQTHKY